MFAVVIEQIDVMSRNFARQASTHLGAKNFEPQSLRFTDLVLMLCPTDLNSAFGAARHEIHNGVGLRRMK
jgi:hypothetical protein